MAWPDSFLHVFPYACLSFGIYVYLTLPRLSYWSLGLKLNLCHSVCFLASHFLVAALGCHVPQFSFSTPTQ